jgi:hypothetical protein
MPKEYGDPIIFVKLQEGLADRHRLPLNHVIGVLEEIRQMVTEAGREIQRERGIERPTGDFGLELIADDDGIVFRQGSVEAAIAITSDVSDGFLAAQKIVNTVERLREERQKKTPTKEDFDHGIVRRLSRIARIQRTDRTRLAISVRPAKSETLVPALPDYSTVFDQVAIDQVRSLQAPTFSVDGMVIFGKLTELKDRDEEENSIRGFWGELKRENGEAWRIQFKAGDADAVTRLFRKQVTISGKAYYYRAHAPKLVATETKAEHERDYEAAFDELYGCDKNLYKSDLSTLLKEMRGE